jgi:hypothetical protein
MRKALFIFLILTVPQAFASSHREALAVLNEPCADNTDTYAWVSDGAHDKLYLIMDFNPLHEPGQGNQGFRACNGYRYEFHIGKGTSLKDEAVYRIEFKNTLNPESGPGPTDNLGGGNELLWQLTGGTETMTVTRVMAPGSANPVVLGENLKVLPNNHGPQTDRLVYGLGAFKGYDSGESPAAIPVSMTRPSSTPSSTRWPAARASSPASSTIRISSTRRGSSIS